MQSELLKERIFDTADICEKTNRPKFLGFLSLEQAVYAEKLLEHRNIRYELFGGYEGATRVILGCFPDWVKEPDFPLSVLTAEFRKADTVTHRDVLGTLTGLGLKRETIGDILLEEGRAVIFLTEETEKFVLTQVEKIGRVGVKLKSGADYPLPRASEMAEFTDTISSTRLDCVVSAVAKVSRGKAAEIIGQGLVAVNSFACEKSTKTVAEGDVVAVRGSGKFIVISISDKTRKDRTVLKYKKYV